ncbi:MAG: PaaI family thioesterase [Clostridia bacterium]|nr:PaaI family thioesterase [Clostridia bacterium]
MTNEEFEKQLARLPEAVALMSGLCAQLLPTPVSWDAEKMEMTMCFHTDEGVCNPVGWVHGGMIATMFDNGMGVLAGCFADGAFTPTVTLNLEYLRPTPVGEKLLLHAKIVKLGRSLIHMRGELVMESEPAKPCAMASAVFAVHKTKKV